MIHVRLIVVNGLKVRQTLKIIGKTSDVTQSWRGRVIGARVRNVYVVSPLY